MIIGQEVRTSAGDLIALFVERPIRPGQSPADASEEIRAQGGLVGLAHPFDRFRAGVGRKGWEDELERAMPFIDYVEIWNARLFMGSGNAEAAKYASEHNLAGVAVSDAHTVIEVGVAYTILEGPLATPDEFRAALLNGQLVTGHGSRVVRLAMPVTKLIQRLRGNRRVAAA